MSLGDFPVGATIETTFDTRSAGVNTTLVGGAAAVYKNATTTESATGLTLTADFDSRS